MSYDLTQYVKYCQSSQGKQIKDAFIWEEVTRKLRVMKIHVGFVQENLININNKSQSAINSDKMTIAFIEKV